MSGARLLLVVAVLEAGCGTAVVGERCPGLAACDLPPGGDGGERDGAPRDLAPDPDSLPAPDGGTDGDDAARPDGWVPPGDGAPGDGDGGSPDDGPPTAGDGPCPPGEQLCNGQCTTPITDPDNCGSCGHVCQSGICLSGVCQDAAWGHLVLLGHDFAQPGTNERRELANAVFLSLASPVRVAVYREYASDAVASRVVAALTAEAALRGRAVATTLYTDRAAFLAALGDVEAALLVPQDLATNDALSGAAAELLASLQAFLRSGGVLVVLDGTPAANSGTWQLVGSLTAVTGVVEVTAAYVTVVRPVDAVALGLTATYRAASRSVAFTYTGTGDVARAALGPVLIHDIVPP